MRRRTAYKVVYEDPEPTNEPICYMCMECGDTFKTDQGLRIHIGRKHVKLRDISKSSPRRTE